MNEIISALKRDKGQIRDLEYSKIIGALKELGYTGAPERWSGSRKRKVKEVLPEKIEWFVKQNVEVDPRQVREALGRGSVRV